MAWQLDPLPLWGIKGVDHMFMRFGLLLQAHQSLRRFRSAKLP